MINPAQMVINITKQYGLHQVLRERAHVLYNTPLCTDLVFSSQSKLKIKSVVHPPLHLNCHHQICKTILRIYLPPPYLLKVRHWKDVNTELTKKSFGVFSSQRAFPNTSINEKMIFSPKLALKLLVILFQMKQFYTMTKIHHGLMRKWKR